MNTNTAGKRPPGRRPEISLSIIAALTVLAPAVIAAPGDLDTTFGDSGRVLFHPLPGLDGSVSVHGMAEQIDGKLVVAGTANASGSRVLILARFDPNGLIDTTFGNGGVVDSSHYSDFGAAIEQQSDGKLVVAGGLADDVALWRFDASGLPDAGFGNGGQATFDFGGDDHAVGVVGQPDGKFVVAASSQFDDDARIVLARIHDDGRIDRTFGDDGTLRIEFPSGDTWDVATAIVREPGGTLLVTGNRYDWDTVVATTAVARIGPDGTLDASFGEDGLVELSFGADAGESTQTGALAVQADGSIVIAGGIGMETGWFGMFPSDGFVARLLPDGTADTSFGSNAMTRVESANWGHYRTIEIVPDGSITASGFEYLREGDDYVGSYMMAARFTPDGTIDPDFGVGGVTAVDFGSGSDAPGSYSASIVRQQSGRLVMAGRQGGALALAGLAASDSAFPGFVGFTIDDREIPEDAGSLAIGVRRTGGSTGTVAITVETHDGSATAGIDYEAVSTRLEWPDGDTSPKTITIDVLDDAESEGDEDFRARLRDAEGGARVAASEMTVYVANDDMPPPPPPPPPPEPTPVPPAFSGGGSSDWLSLLLFGSLLIRRKKKHDAKRQ